ncbi:MAG: hypothetical protein WBF39_17585 [Planococcus donghaensis]
MFLTNALEKEVAEAKLLKKAYLSVDVDELELLLSEIQFAKQIQHLEQTEEEYPCNSCGLPTRITRSEQYTIKPCSDSLKVKCLNCLIDTLKSDQQELEQLKAINWFLKEHNLEEDFDVFLKELSYREND